MTKINTQSEVKKKAEEETRIPNEIQSATTKSARSDHKNYAISGTSSSSLDDSQHCDQYDLRPKFAVIGKLTSEQSSDAANRRQAATSPTPAWFFNIPTSRSPFPDFKSKLPEED